MSLFALGPAFGAFTESEMRHFSRVHCGKLLVQDLPLGPEHVFNTRPRKKNRIPLPWVGLEAVIEGRSFVLYRGAEALFELDDQKIVQAVAVPFYFPDASKPGFLFGLRTEAENVLVLKGNQNGEVQTNEIDVLQARGVVQITPTFFNDGTLPSPTHNPILWLASKRGIVPVILSSVGMAVLPCLRCCGPIQNIEGRHVMQAAAGDLSVTYPLRVDMGDHSHDYLCGADFEELD